MTAYPPVFYPGSNEPSGAAPLSLPAGEELTADLRLREAAGFGATIVLEGDWPPNAMLMITAEGIGGKRRFQHSGRMPGKTQILPAFPPGSYEVTVFGNKAGKFLQGVVTAELGRAHTTVTVPAGPLASVSGQVMCDGKPLAAGPGQKSILFIASDGSRVGHFIQPGGRFELPAVRSGVYRVVLAGVAGCYLDRVEQGGRALNARALAVAGENLTELVIHTRTDRGRVSGIVRAGETAVEGAYVFLLPEKEDAPTSDAHYFKSDSDGSFEFKGVPPGEYRLFATQDFELEFGNRKAVAAVFNRGVKVTVGASAEVEADAPLLR